MATATAVRSLIKATASIWIKSVQLFTLFFSNRMATATQRTSTALRSLIKATESLRIRADSALYFVIFQRNGNGNVYGREEFDKGHRITTNQISSLFTLFSFPTDSMSTRIRSVRLFTLFFANTNAQGLEGHRITKLSHFRMLWIIFIFFLFCFLAGRKQCNKIKIGLHIFNCFTIHFLIVCPAINLH